MDNKDRDFYDNLTDEEKKEFNYFTLLRYASAVEDPNPIINEYYLLSTNRQANRHFYDLRKHPKLQWLLLTTVSPNMGKFRHTWVKQPSGAKVNTDIKKKLMEMHPTMKEADIDVMCRTTTKKEFEQYLKDHGEEQ